MRVFLAIAVPEDVKARLAAAAQRLAPEAVDVAWCPRDQYHLTLAFLGETSPAILPHAMASFEKICAATPVLACRAYGLGFFGNRRNPKTLWAGVDPTPELETLQEELWTALKKFGFSNREAEFRPHITLGRCRESTRNQAVVQAMDADEEVAFGEGEARRITVYESRTTPRGTVYRTLAHAALG